jgi:hypothetical protein
MSGACDVSLAGDRSRLWLRMELFLDGWFWVGRWRFCGCGLTFLWWEGGLWLVKGVVMGLRLRLRLALPLVKLSRVWVMGDRGIVCDERLPLRYIYLCACVYRVNLRVLYRLVRAEVSSPSIFQGFHRGEGFRICLAGHGWLYRLFLNRTWNCGYGTRHWSFMSR